MTESDSEGKVNIFELLRNEYTRLQAAEIILGRKVKPDEIAVTQYFIGCPTPEEILANLLSQAAKEKDLKIV